MPADPNPYDLLVEVFAGEDGNASPCGFATGYPIAQGRIITAGHVLNHGSACIKVRLKESNAGDTLFRVNGVKWDGRFDEFDVAILACSKLPADLFREIPLLETMPISDVAANGKGYPLKSRTEDQSRPESISGNLMPMSSGCNYYELACDDRRGNNRYTWSSRALERSFRLADLRGWEAGRRNQDSRRYSCVRSFSGDRDLPPARSSEIPGSHRLARQQR